ncbi:MAG: PAS domain S-box protein [Gemmatimonadaceae bacterium]|nr:PAS domain S-box protein [Gemmatimonadaceae bacterium]
MSEPHPRTASPSSVRHLTRSYVLGLGLVAAIAIGTAALLLGVAQQAATAGPAELPLLARQLGRIALGFCLTLLAVLALEALFVFRPATRAISTLLQDQDAVKAELYGKAEEMYQNSVQQEMQNDVLHAQQQTLLDQQEELMAQQATLIEQRDHLEERTSELSRLTAILDATPDAVAVFALTGEVLYANAAAELQLLSARRRDWTHAAHLFTSDSVRQLRDVGFPRAIRRGLWQGEAQLRSRGGPQRTVVQTLLAHRGADGRVATISAMLQDVTEARMVARELETLSVVAQQSDHAISTTDGAGFITWVNPAWERLTGYTLDEAMGRRPGDMLQGTHTNTETVAQMRHALARGTSFSGELLNYRKDGSPFWIEMSITPSLDAKRQITGFVGLSRDVTVRRNAERERQQLAAAVAVTADGIAITGVSGALEFVNHAFARMHGYRPSELLQTPWASLYEPTEAQRLVREAIPEVTQVGFWQGEVRGRTRDGTCYPEELSLTLLPHGGLVSVSRDISDRKAAEERLLHLSVRDELTSLYNRRGFIAQADAMLRLATRQGVPCALLYGDLDAFKAVNDGYGHDAGDDALQVVAGILTTTFRETDLVARLGGDEFTILAIDVQPCDVAMLVDRVDDGVDRSNAARAHDPATSWTLGISLGVAYFDPASPQTVDALLRTADEAQYERKRQRKGGADQPPATGTRNARVTAV